MKVTETRPTNNFKEKHYLYLYGTNIYLLNATTYTFKQKSILQTNLQEKQHFNFHPTNNYLFTKTTSTNKENPTKNSPEESSVASSSSASSVYSNVSPIP